MLRKKKKGISPLVATILLIGFVIAIIMLVILWGRGYVEELAQKRGLLAEKQQQCTNVDLTAVKAERLGEQVKVVLKNQGSLTINKFVFRVVGGETGEGFESRIPLRGLEVKEYIVVFSESEFPDVNNVDVIPHLQVALGHYVPCSKQSIRVKVKSA